MSRSAHVQSAILTRFGAFAEPAFALLGNPAPLYSELLRKLAPFGASVSTLNLDVSSLENAHVLCQLKDFVIRVKLLGIEVVSYNEALPGIDVFRAVVSAVTAADSTLSVVRQDVQLSLWMAVEGGYDAFIRESMPSLRHGETNTGTPIRGAWEVSMGSHKGSLHLDRSAADADVVFYRFVMTYPTGDPDAATVSFIPDHVKALESLNLSLTDGK